MKIQAPSPEDFETCKCNSYRLCTGLGVGTRPAQSAEFYARRSDERVVTSGVIFHDLFLFCINNCTNKKTSKNILLLPTRTLTECISAKKKCSDQQFPTNYENGKYKAQAHVC